MFRIMNRTIENSEIREELGRVIGNKDVRAPSECTVYNSQYHNEEIWCQLTIHYSQSSLNKDLLSIRVVFLCKILLSP